VAAALGGQFCFLGSCFSGKIGFDLLGEYQLGWLNSVEKAAARVGRRQEGMPFI
jgi:hypothetical protein